MQDNCVLSGSRDSSVVALISKFFPRGVTLSIQDFESGDEKERMFPSGEHRIIRALRQCQQLCIRHWALAPRTTTFCRRCALLFFIMYRLRPTNPRTSSRLGKDYPLFSDLAIWHCQFFSVHKIMHHATQI